MDEKGGMKERRSTQLKRGIIHKNRGNVECETEIEAGGVVVERKRKGNGAGVSTNKGRKKDPKNLCSCSGGYFNLCGGGAVGAMAVGGGGAQCGSTWVVPKLWGGGAGALCWTKERGGNGEDGLGA